MLKQLTLAMLFVSVLTPLVSSAQVILRNDKMPSPYSDLKTLAGYQPSLLASESSALSVYRLLPTDIFKNTSWCYQRAHVWTHSLEQQFGIKSMKVYLYFTRRYQREFDYTWTYHTAPLIPTVMNDGSIQDLVFDPTFTSTPRGGKPEQYDDKPVSVESWTKYFVFPNVKCKTIDNYQEFVDNQEAYYCYIMKAPMYNYSAQDFERDLTGETGISGTPSYDSFHKVRAGWRIGDTDNMLKSLKSTN